jgi:N-acetylglucosaminyldiphosphoundecaprenol N-acetyl-beta-D-mannosaminyltransferase
MPLVFGIEFSPLTQSELVTEIAGRGVPTGNGPRAIVTANLDHIAHLSESAEFRAAYDNAWAVTADGMPVFAYAKLRGAASPARVPGSDLVAELLPALSPETDRIFFVASSWRTARRLQVYLVSRGFSRARVTFEVPPFGFESDNSFSDRLASRICAHRTTHLLFGVGAPKSEIWVNRYRDRLGDCYALCVGAGLDFFAQTKRRAPTWMRKVGLEWFWRLAQEPGRLWRRYTVHAWRFITAIKDDLTSGGMWAPRH